MDTNEFKPFTEETILEFQKRFGSDRMLHDSLLKSFEYQIELGKGKTSLKITLEAIDHLESAEQGKSWVNNNEIWIYLEMQFREIRHLYITKEYYADIFGSIFGAKIGILDGQVYVALDSDYPKLSFDDLVINTHSMFFIAAPYCDWRILPHPLTQK